jgi:peptidoglycan glycosyltransferase
VRSTRARSIVIYVLATVFIVGLSIFTIRIFINGGSWSTSYINKHISNNGKLALAGKVLDRNGEVLAYSKDGKRNYNSNKNIRTAVLHTVGDDSSFISTAVQNAFRYQLVGYNPITGLGLSGIVSDGNDLTLTIDSNICDTAYKAFGKYNGAAVLYNYKTGEILCMVSSPSYDPLSPPDLESDNTGKYDGVYLNRCLSSSLTPGSIFKIVTAAAAIENIPGVENRTFHCDGSIEVDGNKITCLEHHGDISLTEGMAKSCNIVFAQLAMELGAEKMLNQALSMGFDKDIFVDDIKLSKSHYDTDSTKKFDLGWSGVGQYTDLVNPMHMAIIMGAIANNGLPVTPYMVERISTPYGMPIKEGYGTLGVRLIKSDTAKKLKDIMRYTVKNDYGDNLFPGLEVCAKTGTGETGAGKQPNAWMVGFSKDSDCPLAFSVVVENSGFGYKVAGPIAEKMMQQGAKLIREGKS